MIHENKEEKLVFEIDRLTFNLQKIRMINKIYLIVFISLIIIIYMLEIVSSFQFNRSFFLWRPYCSVLVIVNIIYFYLLDIRKIKVSEKNYKLLNILINCYMAFFLSYAALLPILNHNFYYPIVFYTFLLFSCVPFLFIKSKEILLTLCISSLLFVIALAFQDGNEANYYLQVIYILTLSAIAFLITKSAYFNYQLRQNLRIESMQEIQHFRNLTDLLKEANRQLQLEATLDPLTNLYNRRAYNDYLIELQQKIRESSYSISVIMVDVDCFKLYNDTYGHSEGDHVLVKIGGLLHSISIEYDCFAGRFGGEEFVLILSNQPEDDIERICCKIRKGVYELTIPHLSSTIDTVVTVSIGACTKLITDFNEIYECISEADAALYSVKENGRNSFEYRHRIHA